MKLVSLILICVTFTFFTSCIRDMIMEIESDCQEIVTYNEQIRPLMNGSCGYSGCHLGGAAPGDFTNYDGIAKFINGGLIENRVVIARNMPPNNATQGPTMLTDDEIELFKCWIQAGYPEN